ncbi:MAG: sigma-70 family RNA polymerase sigma factor [Dehalococcoidia bacterium]|nr:sigma-70 family RNA polymerase sigma factor [Dehalococcoidia bacterium]
MEELYEGHHRRVLFFALGIVNNRMTAEEVVQDAFSKVWSRAGTYRPELGKVSSWVLSIAHHRAIDVLRRQRHE